MRFVFAIMLCVANMIIYGLKVNLNTAIIAMVRSNATDNSTVDDGVPRYDWDSGIQGNVISIYFVGYLIGMFPSGYFADQ